MNGKESNICAVYFYFSTSPFRILLAQQTLEVRSEFRSQKLMTLANEFLYHSYLMSHLSVPLPNQLRNTECHVVIKPQVQVCFGSEQNSNFFHMEFYAFAKCSNLQWSQYEFRQGIPHVGSFLAGKKEKIVQKWVGKDKFGNGPLAYRIQQPITKYETTIP